jgi:glycine cleavage system H protein
VDVRDSFSRADDHAWLRVEGHSGMVERAAYAAEHMGDIAFVKAPVLWTRVVVAQPCGVVESVKAVSGIFSPVSRELVEMNDALTSAQAIVNSDRHGGGWMMKIRPVGPSETGKLKNAAAHRTFVETR